MVMRALTVRPGRANSTRLEEIPEPPRSDGSNLVRARALGMCGTDREIVSGEYGWAPPGEDRLVLGHESLGVVEEAPNGSGFATGDLVVGIVRRPDPVPCPACAAGERCYTIFDIQGRGGGTADREQFHDNKRIQPMRCKHCARGDQPPEIVEESVLRLATNQ
jgi:threonine dehydrogenase-like Zn-dependent dehydrogenase